MLRDWTHSELNEIQRLQTKCDENKGWHLECSHTDIGDPWCIIYDVASQKVLLHIARIDREYVIVFPLVGKSSKRGTMEWAVDLAVHQLSAQRFTVAGSD